MLSADHLDSDSKFLRNPHVLWKFTKDSHAPSGTLEWRVGSVGPGTTVEDHRKNLEQTSDLLNSLEVSKTRLEAELSEAQKTLKSLREDLSSFSTFEQICNSGMLRNFKIDSESEFAQTILRLLQRTMELQISLLDPSATPRRETSDENSSGTTGVPLESEDGLTGPDDNLRPVEGTT